MANEQISKQWTDQIRKNYAMIQQMLDNAKFLTALSLEGNLDGLGEFMIYQDGQTLKATIQQIVDKVTFESSILIAGVRFRLYKHPDNSDPLNILTLEVDDVIIGYSSDRDFLNAIYLGGDETDFRNQAVYNNFGGFYLDAS